MASRVGLTGDSSRRSWVAGFSLAAGCVANPPWGIVAPRTSLEIEWQGRKDSNPRPSVLETDALTRLSYAPIGRSQILPSQYDPGVIDSGFRTSGAKRAEQEATKGGFGAKRAQWLLTICPS